MRSLFRFIVPLISMAAGVAVVALHGGCNSSSGPSVPTTVRGRITFQGQPLVVGLVVFTPDPERGGSGKPARAETGSEGEYALQLGESFTIPVGWYRVAIAPPPTVEQTDYLRANFPAKLGRPDLSGLAREVTAGKEHVFDFAIEIPGH